MLYKQNLYKSGYFAVNPDEVRVIDSDSRMAEIYDTQREDNPFAPDGAVDYVPDSFDENEEQIAMLLGENPVGEGDATEGDVPAEGAEPSAQAEDARSSMTLKEAQRILDEAQQNAREIIEQAKQESAAEIEAAYEKAKQQGYEEGKIEGQKHMDAQLSERMQKLDQMDAQRKERYDEMVGELEPLLVRRLSDIYEHLIGVELSQYKSVLTHLISNTLRNTETSDNYLLHVSQQDFSYVSMQKNQLLEECGIKNAHVEVVEDKTLAKNQCLIETDNGIYDCSLAVQMEELKRKLMLLAYQPAD